MRWIGASQPRLAEAAQSIPMLRASAALGGLWRLSALALVFAAGGHATNAIVEGRDTRSSQHARAMP